MHFPTLLSTGLALALSLTGAFAAPLAAPASEAAQLERRAVEQIYMSVCDVYTLHPSLNTTSFKYWEREFDYYSDTNQSQNGQIPSYANRALFGDYRWTQSARPKFNGNNAQTFPSGVTFSTYTISTAFDSATAVGQYVGTGNNGYHAWTCYRDSGRELFRTWSWVNGVQERRRCYAAIFCMH